MPESLYVHIPFCVKKCLYCDFVSGVYDSQKESLYVDALRREILGISVSSAFRTLYMGGGTPTVLSSDALQELIRQIFKTVRFDGNYEATIEANPGVIAGETLRAIRSLGINRLSVGIQSFDDGELRLLGRIHSAAEAEEAVLLAASAGLHNVGIDLIYGIPGQKMETWKKTLERAVRLGPKHISAYELTPGEGTVMNSYLRRKMLEVPEEESIIGMYNHAIDYLTKEGYLQYEISNFSLPGYECRHNLNYWNGGDYLGIGLGAHSHVKRVRYHNTYNFEEYIRLLSQRKSPVKEEEELTCEESVREALFLGLRKTAGVNLKRMSELHGRYLDRSLGKTMEMLSRERLVDQDGEEANVRLTRRGLLLSNEVFVKLI
jgi:oxygen-independent coproporphyrinogen-3 oxidase